MTGKQHPRSIPYETVLANDLQDREFAAAYLNECLEDEEDLSVFLLALRQIIQAQGIEMMTLAKQLGISHESLYKLLSLQGNLELRYLKAILDALGFKIHIASNQ